MSANPLPPSWMRRVGSEFYQDYMHELGVFLRREHDAGTRVWPQRQHTFRAFSCTPFEEVKVVVLGQDPYHGPGQATGLSFSVPEGVAVPPSLRNIFAEQAEDVGVSQPACGDLVPWARQGVLLLNSTLTVREGEAGSHRGQGWERFTDAVVSALVEHRQGLVFLLWGADAQRKAGRVLSDVDHGHHVLTAPHPSPLSAHRGFFGCRHFSQTNALLAESGRTPIDWQLPS